MNDLHAFTRNQAQFLRTLANAGFGESEMQTVVEDGGNELARALVASVRRGGGNLTSSVNVAREIMGANFIGVEVGATQFHCNLTRAQVQALAHIPFPKDLLQECGRHYLLAMVPAISIIDLRQKVARPLFHGHDRAWYNGEGFVHEHGEPRWYLIRKDPIPNSMSKTWPEQERLLSVIEETPPARVIAYVTVALHLTARARLFECCYVRCSDFDSEGCRVVIGGFDSVGIKVSSYRDHCRRDNLGMTSIVKS